MVVDANWRWHNWPPNDVKDLRSLAVLQRRVLNRSAITTEIFRFLCKNYSLSLAVTILFSGPVIFSPVANRWRHKCVRACVRRAQLAANIHGRMDHAAKAYKTESYCRRDNWSSKALNTDMMTDTKKWRVRHQTKSNGRNRILTTSNGQRLRPAKRNAAVPSRGKPPRYAAGNTGPAASTESRRHDIVQNRS